jgi:predicted dinucleotide-binding enzyme
MKIGILGAGRVGGTLGIKWASAGHEVMFGVRNPEADKVKFLLEKAGPNARAGALAQASQFGEAILLAIPWPALGDVLTELGPLEGKVLIDATNRRETPRGSRGTAAEDIAEMLPKARVVKGFNTTGTANMANPRFGEMCIDNYICGDDAEAKAMVTQLSKDVGFDVVDVGELSIAGLLESLGLLWIHLVYRQKMGPAIAFKLLKQ